MKDRLKLLEKKICKIFQITSEKLLLYLPDWITGKRDVMAKKYYVRYGAGDISGLIRRNKIRTLTSYMMIAAAILLSAAGLLIGQSSPDEEIRSLRRPEFGTGSVSVPLEAKVIYSGYEWNDDLTLRVKQKALDKDEKLALLYDYGEHLRKIMLGENKDPQHISKPLNLVERDMSTGITVNWTSDAQEIISETGEVNLIGAAEPETVTLSAELVYEDAVVTEQYILMIDLDAGEEAYRENMAERLKDRVSELLRSNDSDSLKLPEELGDGMEVQWFIRKENNSPILIAAFLMIFLITFFKRYDRIDREIKEAEESILRDLPEFINKLVLLLNAGLVVSSAFTRIAADYQMSRNGKYGDKSTRRFLYEELVEMEKRVDRSHASLLRELADFSRRCGVREMIRITGIISDNWNKGSELSEKLEAESELMWLSRKKRAEEKGRLAETKLAFPLMILLMVLIMITIAPAMLEM